MSKKANLSAGLPFLEEKYDCLRINIGGGDNMKKALIFLFDGFAEFEVNIASLSRFNEQ
ncbi:hypothetical protein bcgnr5390_33390 [Bacillus luti]